MSSMRLTNLIYAIKMTIRITPSSTAITVSDVINLRHSPAINRGSTIKIPMAMIKENIITTVMSTLSSFSPSTLSSHASNLDGVSSSSSSKKLQDQVRARMPRIMESAKLKIPRIKGSPRILAFLVILT